MTGDTKRYVIIHGHFYQPPRESPWTGLIAPEPSAAPFPNWNERILSECYAANAHAHTMDGPLVRISNNYQWLSFDFGPTLMGWLTRHGKSAYRALIRADAASIERTGYGNAIAQSYNHSILPIRTSRSPGASRTSNSASDARPRRSGCPNAPPTRRRWKRLPAPDSNA